MKITDLMVGDWVSVNGLNLKVGAIHADEIGVFDPDYKIYWCSDDGLDHIDPIPLTEEILVKNGFELCCDAEQQPFYRYKEDWCIGLWLSSDGFDYDLTIEVHYVHQLQHLLRLCGIEKEIEL